MSENIVLSIRDVRSGEALGVGRVPRPKYGCVVLDATSFFVPAPV